MNLIKEARRAIRLALIRIAMPLIYKAEKPNEFRTVFRIQNARGEGPNNPAVWKSTTDYDLYAKSMRARKLPSFAKDEGFDQDGREAFSKDYLFGFRSADQFNYWHSPLEINLLKTNGFSLTERKASEIRDSDRQIIFLPFKG